MNIHIIRQIKSNMAHGYTGQTIQAITDKVTENISAHLSKCVRDETKQIKDEYDKKLEAERLKFQQRLYAVEDKLNAFAYIIDQKSEFSNREKLLERFDELLESKGTVDELASTQKKLIKQFNRIYATNLGMLSSESLSAFRSASGSNDEEQDDIWVPVGDKGDTRLNFYKHGGLVHWFLLDTENNLTVGYDNTITGEVVIRMKKALTLDE